MKRITPQLCVFALGLLLASAGFYLIYPPAGLIVLGLVLMAITVFGGKA